jgi:hypothetical protein
MDFLVLLPMDKTQFLPLLGPVVSRLEKNSPNSIFALSDNSRVKLGAFKTRVKMPGLRVNKRESTVLAQFKTAPVKSWMNGSIHIKVYSVDERPIVNAETIYTVYDFRGDDVYMDGAFLENTRLSTEKIVSLVNYRANTTIAVVRVELNTRFLVYPRRKRTRALNFIKAEIYAWFFEYLQIIDKLNQTRELPTFI